MADSSSDSDFDDDEDPDKIEIPGFNFLQTEEKYQTTLPEKIFKEESEKKGIQKKSFIDIKNRNVDKIDVHNHFIDEEEAENDEIGTPETYAVYMPAKLKFGRKHPDPVVESASLSSVAPVDVWYELSIPKTTIETGGLSALQLESITYACQKHETLLPDGSRAGFLIGDGAGVGKGRTIAGIIFENFIKSRKKALWVSVSNDLKYDALRDLADIGANNIPVHQLSKFKYAKLSSSINGGVKRGVIFSTYSALIGESSQNTGKYNTRLKQVLQWCGKDFDGPIIFDECHRAKNLFPSGSSKSSKTGLVVLELQKKLPNARVVYASATGASEPRNMAYMTRLGMWGQGTPFPKFTDFIYAVENQGVGAMESVAMDMKLRGSYIARQLSFHGVGFRIEEVSLSKEFVQVYNSAVRLWVEALQKFHEASNLIEAESGMKKAMWGQFWSSHQRFFKYLCIGAKVKHAVKIAREAIKCGKCVVIGLQSTGEARTLEQLDRDDGEISEFVSTAKGVLQSLVEKHFPAPDRDRIERLLGLDLSANSFNQSPISHSNNKMFSNKRKKKPQKTNIDIKKKKFDLNEVKEDCQKKCSSSEDSGSDNVISDDDVASNASSNYNPFSSNSDSDVEPWERRKQSHKSNNENNVEKTSADNVATKKNLPELNQFPKNDVKNKKEDIEVAHCSINASPSLESTKGSFKSQVDYACYLKSELLQKIEKLGEKLPPNTLDQLIDELGGPDNVAEMTGRKGRIIQNMDGNIQYESRSETDVSLETLNIVEKQRFMDGEKMVAIISDAASSGISLQSDRRSRNQRRRIHITLELPWSADRAIQQFGRTHRSNQVNAPEYIFLISNLAGERRFASIIAKRLESLGALTHGDRRAGESRDLSQFNIDNKYGRAALESALKAIVGYTEPLVPIPPDYPGDFFKDAVDALAGVGLVYKNDNSREGASLDKDYNSISKFLNRILGIPVELQNKLFQYFTDTLNRIIEQEKKSGRYDMGIVDIGRSAESVCRTKLYQFLMRNTTGINPIELHVIRVDRGLDWDDVMDKYNNLHTTKEGFYLSRQFRNNKKTAIFISRFVEESNSENDVADQYIISRPHSSMLSRKKSISFIEKTYEKVAPKEAEYFWKLQYTASLSDCLHSYLYGNCKKKDTGANCEVGLRQRTYNILSGSVLSIWNQFQSTLSLQFGHLLKMQIVRLKTDDDVKIVGTLIPSPYVKLLYDTLVKVSDNVKEQNF